MSSVPTSDISQSTDNQALPLRIWPGVAIVLAYWVAAMVAKPVGGFVTFVTMVAGAALGLLLLTLWWVGFSRARWFERLAILLLIVGGTFASNRIADGMTAGVPWTMYLLPWLMMLWVGAAWFARKLAPASRLFIVGAAIVIGLLSPLVVRFEGVTGAMDSQPAWRWTPTAEERFIAELRERAAAPSTASLSGGEPAVSGSLGPSSVVPDLVVTEQDWAEFRGPLRDGVVRGPVSLTDWSVQPPKEIWRRKIGPSWSSLTVVGDFIFTQEQRGEQELVSCYALGDGREVWLHAEQDRFEEPAAGAGPRGTPTFAGGKLFVVTAKGNVLCLNAKDGSPVWKRSLAEDTGATLPVWGFSSSPLVVGKIVTLISCGPSDKAVVAYDIDTGDVKWTAGQGTHSYSSCQHAELDGQSQILSATDYGLQSFATADGKLLWEYLWKLPTGARMLQPQVVGGNRVLLSSYLDGTALVEVHFADSKWEVKEVWKSRDLKGYFNDAVVHKGAIYGFDDKIFACVDLETGKRKWKKGRYGFGQVLGVAEADRLIILSETGDAVLVAADPSEHKELGKFTVLPGKTWNHPTIVRNRLLVRNAEEMACYDLKP